MLQWDLSDTPLAQRETPGKVPTEGELLVLMVGLLMLEDVSYELLRRRELVFQKEDLGRLAEILEYRVPELAREFGDSECLRKRLAELTGIRMTRSVGGGRS
jgi:hypothetical protein